MFARISTVVALTLFTAWFSHEPKWDAGIGFALALVAYIGVEVTHRNKDNNKEQGDHVDRSNRIISTRVVSDLNSVVKVEVWYFYDGSFGDEVYVEVCPTGPNGEDLLIGSCNIYGGQDGLLIGHPAKAIIAVYDRQSADAPIRTSILRIAMARESNPFVESKLKFRRSWGTKKTK